MTKWSNFGTYAKVCALKHLLIIKKVSKLWRCTRKNTLLRAEVQIKSEYGKCLKDIICELLKDTIQLLIAWMWMKIMFWLVALTMDIWTFSIGKVDICFNKLKVLCNLVVWSARLLFLMWSLINQAQGWLQQSVINLLRYGKKILRLRLRHILLFIERSDKREIKRKLGWCLSF